MTSYRSLLVALALLAACANEDPLPPAPAGPDVTAPEINEVSVRSKRADPSRAGRGDTLDITFKVSEPVVELEVRLAGRTATCVEPQGDLWSCNYTLTGQESDGRQTVQIKAADAAGNIGQATGSFTVDLTAPKLTITTRPRELDNRADVEIAFEADETATFTCQLDEGEAEACTSPWVFEGIADGPHTIRITATDDVDNASTETIAFTLDLIVPETSLLSGPPEISQLTDVTFVFRSDDPQARFECRLGSAGFEACTSPLQMTAVAEGSYVFEVRAVDPAGNVDPSPVQVAFTLDRTPPVTTFGPIDDTGSPDRTVPFTASEDGCSFVCSVDGGPLEPCTSPLELTGLSHGRHSVDVRATDAAGNVEARFVTAFVEVDVQAPSTSILSGPGQVAATTSATFSFISSEAGSTFHCRVDDEPFASCTSPHTVTVAEEGAHTFEVYAVDRYGNADATPARYPWTVDTLSPTVTVDLAPPALYNQDSFAFEFSGNKANLTFTCVVDGAAPVACTSPYTVSGLGSGEHTFKVIGTDGANRTAESAEVTFTVDLDPPDVSLDSTPPALSSLTRVSFAFSTTEPDGTFECRLDAEPFAACTSPHEVDVGDGAHTFEVRAIDPAGNASTPASFAFTIDLIGPDAPEIVQPIPSLVSNTTPTFSWEAADDAVSYVFELARTPDFGQLVESTTTSDLYFVPAPLASAVYYFRVKAIDALGNESALSKTGMLEVRTWSFLNPTPTGATFHAQSCEYDTCVFVGDAGSVLITREAGKSVASSGVPTALYGLHRLDAATLVAVGQAGTALRTTDGGNTWWPVDAGVGLTDLRAVRFAGQIGFAVGDGGTVSKSTDGGLTWSKLVTDSTSDLRDLAILDAIGTTVVAVGASGRTLRTSDGGATWTEIGVGSNTHLNAVTFVDALNGYAAGAPAGGVSIVQTTDGGLTWSSFPNGGNTRELFDIAVYGNTVITTGDATSTYASIRVTTDGGASWTNAQVPSLATIRTIAMATQGALTGFIAAGEAGAIYGTEQATGPWFAALSNIGLGATDATRDIRSVDFVSETVGYLVGGSGYAMRLDGDGNFSQLGGLGTDLYSVSFYDADHGWIGGGASSDFLYFTSDGTTFTRVRTPDGFGIRSVHAIGPTQVAVAGTQGKIARLVPGSSPAEFAYDVVVDASGTPSTSTDGWRDVKLVATGGFVVGDRGRAARFDSVQGHWVLEPTSIGTSFALQSVWAFDADNAVAVGDSGKIARRTPAGWVAIDSGTTANLRSVTFVDASTGWAVGDGVILHTTDGGQTWSQQVSPTGATLLDVAAVNADLVYAVGGSRTVLKTVVGGR